MLKRARQFFSRDRYFYGFLISLVILIGQLPIILHYFHTPAGYYYPLLDRTAFSDYYYLGIIRYGMGPEWLLKIPYVIYDHQASIIQIFYIFLGKLSLVSGIGPAEIFALFRVLGGILYAASAVLLFKTILTKSQARLAFVFFLLAQPLSSLDFDNWVWHFGEAARKISAMPPHYTFGKGLMILSLVFLIWYLKNRFVSDSSTPGESLYAGYPRGVFIAVASLLVFLAGIIYPPPVFIVLFSLTIASVFCIFARGPLAVLQGVPFKKLMGIYVYLVALILPLIILKLELAKGYPWDMWNKVELGWNTAAMQFEWGYIRMLGILVFFAVFVFFAVLRRKVIHLRNLSYLRILIFIWTISAFLLFPFANVLRLGKFRFIEGAQIVPFAILSVWGWQYIRNKKVKAVFLVIFIANFLIFTVLTARWSTVRMWPLWQNVYFRPQEIQTLYFLQQNAKRNSVVVADTFSANFLPAFANVRTILGFPDFYPNETEFRNDELAIVDILKGKMKEEKAKEFLAKKHADFVYVDTSEYGTKDLYPQLLEVFFRNGPFVIYKVKLGL